MSLENLVMSNQRLGEGGFGSVFVCELGGKKVAAKKMSQSEEGFNNLVGEASKLKRLQYGKHIAYTYGITMKEGNLYMVMEYCELEDLQNYLRRNKESVTHEQKILFCRGILLGLLYCHSMKIFHGDIKCSNVLLGRNMEPKLTDFGLNTTVDNFEYYSKLYKGSLYWTAPELFSIKEDETVYQEFITNPYPCDVYSLGATFCEISYDGTTEFIDSDDPGMDISVGIVSPISKDRFLEEIIDKCCQFERNERISLDECLLMLDTVTEKQLSVPAIDDRWSVMQQDIQANSKLKFPHSFILHRPAENLVVGPSNMSLLEWLCINNCVDAVKYMIQLHENNQNQIKWLYEISELCKSPEVADFLQNIMQNSELTHLVLSNLIDNHPQQFVEMLIRAGASCSSYSLLKKATEKHYNIIVQTIIDSRDHFKNWAIHDAAKFGNAEAVKILAKIGADLEWKNDYTGNTPLITAIENERIEAVKILLELGVDIHSKNKSAQSSIEAEIQHKPLYLAALKGNREIVKLLIDAGATVKIKSSEWHSLSQSLEQQGNISMVRFINNSISKKSNPAEKNTLCTAIQNKQPDLAQTLIDSKVNIDEIDVNGYAPLHWAVAVGNEEIVRILIKVGADLDVQTSDREQNLDSSSESEYFSKFTPLHISVAKGNLEIAKLLIESGADFSAKNGLRQTAMETVAKEDRKALDEIIKECTPANTVSIRRAMKSMDLESIKMMINRQQVNAEILFECLCIAASSGENDLVKYLLKCRVDINNKHQGKTPLEWAIFGENIQAMKILTNAGANINAKNHHQQTVLFQCVWESQVDMMQFLVDKGADMNIRDKDGNAPIHFANDKDILETLINAGANISEKNQNGRMLLIEYATKSNAEIVQFLVDRGADINAKDDGYASIHYANDKEIMRILINAGADVNAKDKYGMTPLFGYVGESNAEMVQFLVKKGANVKAKNKDRKAPVHHTHNREVVELLIDAGADVNAKDKYGMSPLFGYVKESNTEMVQFLVKKGANVKAKDKNGKAPVHHTHKREVMEILINAGADVNTKDKSGMTPLFECIRKSDTEIVQFLVDKGADIDITDKYGIAPIHCANDKKIAEILINAGADINAKDEYGITPLIEYVKESNAEMVQFLVSKGADVNAVDKDGKAPIHHTYKREFIEILLNAGADINAKGQYGKTPLIQHVIKSDAEMVQFLVNNGADVNAADEYGYASIYYIYKREFVEILISAGADVNIKDLDGRTPLFKYVEESNTEIVQFLIDKGADANASDKHGIALIHHTRKREILEILLNAGADVNAKGRYGCVPLDYFVSTSNTEMVQFLVDKGAYVNIKGSDHGDVFIHRAYKKEIMEILINAGADINAKDNYGRTPLIEYVKKTEIETVRFLIEKGADINATDRDGKAPIHYVRDIEMVKILIAAGADINTKDEQGRELFDLLIEVKSGNNNDCYCYNGKKVYLLMEYLKDINKV